MTPEEKKATLEVMKWDVKACVQLIAAATGKEETDTLCFLELYYHVRKAYEDAMHDLRDNKDKAEPRQDQPEEARKNEKTGDLSPTAKAAAFKRETAERLRTALKKKKLSYPRIAEASGIEETRIIRIMEGKPEKVEVYKRLAAGLDKLES